MRRSRLPFRFLSQLAVAGLPAAVVFWAGCAARVQPVAPPVELPAAFSLEGADALPAQWWLSFGDPKLDALVARALAGNFSLRAAWDRLAQAQAALRASGAGLWPSLDAAARETHSWHRQEVTEVIASETSDSGSSDSADSTPVTRTFFDTVYSKEKSFGLMADYEVDLWGRIRSQRNAADLDAQATAQDLATAAITLSAQVAAVWYELQEQQGQLALLDEQIATSETTLKLIDSRFRLGQSSASDVLQQEQLVEARREDRERSRARLRVLQISLAILLGEAPVAADYGVDGSLIDLPPLPATGLPADLVGRRPDVQSAYMAVQAADQRVAAAIINRYPRLSLTASYTTSAENWRELFDDWISTLAANVALPILDGGSRRAEVDRTRAVASQRVNEYGQTILDALGEVEEALVQERQQSAIVASIGKQLSLARKVLERIQAQYLGGSEDYLRVLEAQQSVHVLERDLITARRELIGFRIDLCRALAGGWEMAEPEALADADAAPGPAVPVASAPSAESEMALSAPVAPTGDPS